MPQSIRNILLSLVPFAALACPASAGEPSNPRYVRIGHYQCVCKQGDFAANLETVVKGLQLAAEARLDIVSFPESFLTGYYAAEEDARANCFTIDSPEIKQVLDKTSGFDLLFMVGFNELRGDDLYNTVAVIDRGRLLGHYSKAMPVMRYFIPGREFPVFEKKGLKFGVVICADGGYIEPCRILSLKGAQVIFAPHYNFVGDPVQHYQMVRNDHVARAVENGVYFLRGNNVVRGTELEGMKHQGHGYGDSYLLDPTGEIAASAGLYEEYLMIYNLDREKKFRNRHNWRSMRSSKELADILKQVVDQQQ